MSLPCGMMNLKSIDISCSVRIYGCSPPAFCYPEDWNHLPFPCIVLIRSKARYLDIPALRKDAPQTKPRRQQRWNRFCYACRPLDAEPHFSKKGNDNE